MAIASASSPKSQRQERERALGESAERFRQVVESAPNAMVMVDQDGMIEMVNAQTERVFGYARAELLGQPVEMLVPERFRLSHPGMRRSFFTEPRSRPMGAGRDLYARRKDGSEVPVEIGLNPIETDRGTMVLSAIVDISERKRHEERFRQAVESAPNAMVMVDQDGTIEMVNAQTERVFGYARAELLGQPVEMLVPERFRGGHPGMRGAFFADLRSRPMGAGSELYALRKDGSEVPVEIGLNPIETDEGPKVLSAIVDISDRKHKEERIIQALNEKDILLGEIHHRVKNNLQIVHSLLELQLAQTSDPVVIGILRDGQNRIYSMALIHQTLYQSKDFARVDFDSFLNSLASNLTMSYGAPPNRIAVSTDASGVLLPINIAVPCGLVVSELISNAFKHAFPGGRSGHVIATLRKEPEDQVVLSVSDDGVGIPDEVDIAQTATLGLQLVGLLADQLGADVTIQRVNPTRFELRLSLDPP
jgi:PAS domain S-box-containing protein